MNWSGRLIQKEVDVEDTVLDLGCGIMQNLIEYVNTYPKSVLRCKKIVGVDIFKPYITFLRERGFEAYQHDLTDLPLPFESKSFDVVLLCDVLEHLPSLDHATRLMFEAQRIARKKIIVLSPKKFTSNVEHVDNPYKAIKPQGFGINPYQKHLCLIPEKWYVVMGFNKRIKLHGKLNKLYNFYVKNYIMAKYLRFLGHEVKVLKRYGYDGLGIGEFYNHTPVLKPSSAFRFKLNFLPSKIKKALKYINRKFTSLRFFFIVMKEAKKYDIVHVHSNWKVLFFIPFKKKILEFHGDDIRIHPSNKNKLTHFLNYLFLKFYRNKIFVSTPDLLIPSISSLKNAFWIPNPIDKEHFVRLNPCEKNTAVYFANWYETPDRAVKIAKENGWKLTIIDRRKGEGIPYSQLPRFLEKFEYMIDRHEIKSLSKTALESLHLGLKVVDWKGRIISSIDYPLIFHDPYYNAYLMECIYDLELIK